MLSPSGCWGKENRERKRSTCFPVARIRDLSRAQGLPGEGKTEVTAEDGTFATPLAQFPERASPRCPLHLPSQNSRHRIPVAHRGAVASLHELAAPPNGSHYSGDNWKAQHSMDNLWEVPRMQPQSQPFVSSSTVCRRKISWPTTETSSQRHGWNQPRRRKAGGSSAVGPSSRMGLRSRTSSKHEKQSTSLASIKRQFQFDFRTLRVCHCHLRSCQRRPEPSRHCGS